ncbi:MAG: hypothetical protein R6V35_03510 [Candidatus Nanohaloarchaea archaeon]
MKKQEYSKLHTIYYNVAIRLVDDLDETAYGDIDMRHITVGKSKDEQRKALSVLSEVISDEIGGPSLDLYDEDDRNILYDSENLLVAKPGNYEFEFGDHTVTIGDQAVKKWNILYDLSQGDEFRESVNQNFSGSSPLSSQNMSDWSEKIMDDEGRLKQKYRSGLEEVLERLHDSDEVNINYLSGDELNLDSIRRPYARPGIVNAVQAFDGNFFDSSFLDSRRSNWKIGQHLSDLVTMDVLESRGSKYTVQDEEALEKVESHVEEVYEDLILDTLEEFNQDQVIQDLEGRGLETFRRNDGSEKLREVKDDDYSGEVLDFLEELGAIDDSEDSRVILADDEDLEVIESVLSSKREERTHSLMEDV